MVLSSHQILCGKLERVDQLLVRDVFDVLTAADEDPAALPAAAGMVSQQRAAAIESGWREAGGMLTDNFQDSIRGARRAVGTRLGRQHQIQQDQLGLVRPHEVRPLQCVNSRGPSGHAAISVCSSAVKPAVTRSCGCPLSSTVAIRP